MRLSNALRTLIEEGGTGRAIFSYDDEYGEHYSHVVISRFGLRRQFNGIPQMTEEEVIQHLLNSGVGSFVNNGLETYYYPHETGIYVANSMAVIRQQSSLFPIQIGMDIPESHDRYFNAILVQEYNVPENVQLQ